jgi:hypothetical protein
MPSDVRRERLVSAPCGEGGAIAFVSGFLQSLDNAMRRGRHKQWCAVRELSLTPRGILDVPETMAIRARGRRPYIAQRVPRVTANTDVNRLLKLALLICDRWARAQAVLSPKIVAAVRGYLPLFADVDATVLARTARRLLAHLFCSAIGDRTISPETRQALIYARTIVLQTLTGDGGGLLDEALFWDLETLFESAVRNAVTKSPLLLGGNVFDGKDHPRVVFVDNQSRFRACPDVVARQGDRHIFVSDCKYVDIKDAELSKHGHVYQLLAHASAYAAKESCLFYPGSAFGAERVGITRDGVRVHAFTLRVSELVKDVHEALRHVLTQESPAGPA